MANSSLVRLPDDYPTRCLPPGHTHNKPLLPLRGLVFGEGGGFPRAHATGLNSFARFAGLAWWTGVWADLPRDIDLGYIHLAPLRSYVRFGRLYVRFVGWGQTLRANIFVHSPRLTPALRGAILRAQPNMGMVGVARSTEARALWGKPVKIRRCPATVVHLESQDTHLYLTPHYLRAKGGRSDGRGTQVPHARAAIGAAGGYRVS